MLVKHRCLVSIPVTWKTIFKSNPWIWWMGPSNSQHFNTEEINNVCYSAREQRRITVDAVQQSRVCLWLRDAAFNMYILYAVGVPDQASIHWVLNKSICSMHVDCNKNLLYSAGFITLPLCWIWWKENHRVDSSEHSEHLSFRPWARCLEKCRNLLLRWFYYYFYVRLLQGKCENKVKKKTM